MFSKGNYENEYTRVGLTSEDRSAMNTFSHIIELYFLDLLNELTNWNVTGHICMGKDVHCRNDHRQLDEPNRKEVVKKSIWEFV